MKFMKNIGFKLFIAITILFLSVSCDKSDDEDQDVQAWKNANEQVFNSIKSNSEFKELKSPGNEGSVYYKVLTKGTGTKPIYYTSTVKVYYSGRFVADGTKYGIKNGDFFEQKTIDYSMPTTFYVNGGVITGWKTSLPYMVKGDKWEIYVPYILGYGNVNKYDSDGRLTIPAYSTLAFEIEIVDIVQ
jgi:peptidylprolyl isomerase/FKBP-type peptidyl-prolyl cis-trans isomerase FklB